MNDARDKLIVALDVDNASRAVSAIISAGMLPAALEMMDNAIIRAVEASVFTAGLQPMLRPFCWLS